MGQATAIGHQDKIRENKNSTQLNPDIKLDKQCEPASYDPLHIVNTEITHLIFVAIEKRDTYTLTKQVGSLLLQEKEKSMSASYMTMIPAQ